MRTPGAALVACLLTALVIPTLATSTRAVGDERPGVLVSEQPAAGTPHVLDGEVRSVVRIGRTIVLGGTFTRARNAGDSAVLHRRGLLAFDASTGRIVRGFHPGADSAVNVVRPGPPGTVYVGGSFDTVGGVRRGRVALVSVPGGRVLRRFSAGHVDGDVTDLRLHQGRLWVAGSFTRVGGIRQAALATLRPGNGSAASYMRVRISGTHRSGLGRTMVTKLDIAPGGRRLVAIGNFRSVAGARRQQVFQLDLGPRRAARASFSTSFYVGSCKRAFYTYVRDVDYSPDGSYFVVGTTGGHGGALAPCDSVARFETRGGQGAAPSWVAHTGGDTIHAVEATRAAVYVGGHQRWWNNPFGNDRAGAGAVPREGIAALSAVNGLPYSWNPGRTRGVGVFDFLLTGAGLWVASDTDRIGHFRFRSRIARLLPGGPSYPAWSTPRLPTTAYLREGGGLTSRRWTGTSAGPAEALPAGGPDWADVRGAFLLAGWLYVASADGSLTRRRFDGTGYGAAQRVATADNIKPLWSWRREIASATGMFYDRGRIYFTRRGSALLHYRYFNPESGVVGARRLTAPGQAPRFHPAAVRGMALAGRYLFWTTGDGRLRRIRWHQTAQAGRTAGSSAVVSRPAEDGVTWGRLFFFGQPGTSVTRG